MSRPAFGPCALIVFAVLLPGSLRADPPDPSREAQRLQREQKWEQSAEKYQQLIESNPYVGAYYYGQGFALHTLKRYDEARESFQSAIERGTVPDGCMYNIACGFALSGKKQEAFEWLARALDAGFTEQETLENDTDVDTLRDDPRFALLTGIKPADGLSRDQQWIYDIDFLARRMKQMHWDLYARVGEKQFHGQIETLKADVPKLKDHQIAARLKRIVASVGDGHTTFVMQHENTPWPWYPLGLYQFTEGLYVVAGPPQHSDLLGAKVLRIGSLDAAAAMEAIKPYCSVDNAMGYLEGGPKLLMSPPLLEAIGATPDEQSVELTLELRDGGQSTVKLAPVMMDRSGHQRREPEGSILLHDTLDAPQPLYVQDRGTPLWREYLPEKKMLYVFFGGVADPQGSTFAKFMREMFEFIESNDVRYLVIDMRLNGGGNTGLVMPLIHGLIKCEKINQPGKLFVIIGRRTFSAAQNTTSLIEMHTNATFVGEPTGASPNFVGESTWFTLPYHRNRVHCSSRYWQFKTSIDRRTWIAPQIAAPPSFAHYSTNRDPAMDAIVQAVQAVQADASTATTNGVATGQEDRTER